MRILRSRFLTLSSYHLLAILTVVIVTLILRGFRNELGIQVIALLYLIPVMISTAIWGFSPGILAGFTAFLFFNYFFIPPYHTFVVFRTQDLITLIVFLIVSAVISQLLGRAKMAVAAANNREREATRLYELSASLSGLQDNTEIANILAQHAQETFLAIQVEVQIEGKPGEASFTVRFPNDPALQAEQDQETKLIQHPLLTARGREGEIRLWMKTHLLPAEERLLQTFASQGALSIERTRLSITENRASVLEESDRLKSALLSSVSHELRTPLATIKASVSSLRSNAVEPGSAAGHDLLTAMEEETDHLNQLVGNLLDMSRIETGALKPDRKWNSLAEIVAGVTKRLSQSLHQHSIELDLPADLPLVPTDYIQMQQVFTNLISNSVKYAPENTTIWIRARVAPEQNLLVQVVNQGPAVAEEHLDRIFDKFYRVTAADKVTGTGLGLSICKGIIEAHGGKIWAENAPGKFIFNFTLPLAWEGAYPLSPVESKNE